MYQAIPISNLQGSGECAYCVLQIRFFERIKLERRIKQLSGKAQRGHALSATEQQQIQKLKQDLQVCTSWCLCMQCQRHINKSTCLQYVLHFPKGERYVSILKDAAEPEAQAKLDAERIRLKAVIKRQLAESAMLTEADEGLSLAESTVGPSVVPVFARMHSVISIQHECFEKHSWFITSEDYRLSCKLCHCWEPGTWADELQPVFAQKFWVPLVYLCLLCSTGQGPV